ncbi:MAG TPA: RNase A-like domain-containing protein [Candidatus Dormibacteraeota bacterium]|jgi:hypothetical protein
MELDGGYDRPRVRPTARRRPGGAPRLRWDAPLSVESLAVYERNGDGHTLGRHCASSPAVESDRLARYRELPATGSFTNAATAQRAVEACVAANRDDVVSWRAGYQPRLVIHHPMNEVIGGVLRRSRWAAGDTLPQPATALRVVLRRNPAYPSGFAVLTAYPVRHDPPSRSLPQPPLPATLPIAAGPGSGDTPLRRRLRADSSTSQASAFSDRAVARMAVARALEAAGADLDDWLLCAHRPRLTVDTWIGALLGLVLTRDAYRRRRGSVAAHSVHVVLHRSPSPPWGFSVAAAYPRLP